MSRFAIDVTREGGWWMGHIPELGGLTQARYPARGRANGTRVHRGQYRNAHRPGGYQLASLPAVTLAGGRGREKTHQFLLVAFGGDGQHPLDRLGVFRMPAGRRSGIASGWR